MDCDHSKLKGTMFGIHDWLSYLEVQRQVSETCQASSFSRCHQCSRVEAKCNQHVAYFGGDSDFEAEPAGPVVVFGAISGLPLAPPLSVIPDPPPDDMPVVPDFFMASEFEFVIPALSV
jgi:hypothetical protein